MPLSDEEIEIILQNVGQHLKLTDAMVNNKTGMVGVYCAGAYLGLPPSMPPEFRERLERTAAIGVAEDMELLEACDVA